MKNLLIFLLSFICIVINAQKNNSIAVGTRNNLFIYGTYYLNEHFLFSYTNTVYSRKINAQYFRIEAGYNFSTILNNFKMSIYPYYGRNYGGAYFDTGILINVVISKGKFKTKLEALPFYDNLLGNYLTASGMLSYSFAKKVSPFVQISSIPEYRRPENRIAFGVLFKEENIWIRPEISTPITSTNIVLSRFLLSFEYQF